MTFNNLCSSCTNIGCEFQSGIVRTECAFYMPPHIESDNCGNYVVMQPTVEAIPKEQYKTRLKADIVAMLEELKKEIEGLDFFEGEKPVNITQELMDEVKNWKYGVKDCKRLIQDKINALKAEREKIK